jgi:hypothetical protein
MDWAKSLADPPKQYKFIPGPTQNSRINAHLPPEVMVANGKAE